MSKAKFNIVGNVKLYSYPSDYTFEMIKNLSKEERELHLVDQGNNLVVDMGLAQIVNLMVGANTTSFTYCRVGTGTSTPLAGDTDMGTILSTGVIISSRYRAGVVAYFDTFFSTTANNGTWTETGIATASTGGELLCRRKFTSSFVKATTNTALVSWSITLAAVAD